MRARFDLFLADEDATDRLGRVLAHTARAGDTILLRGPIGAGKSHLARALIRARAGAGIEVPSPSFTLVQSYDLPGGEVWHADLYRLAQADELVELGLDGALGRALCLIEWPVRLGGLAPAEALEVALAVEGEGRRAVVSGGRAGWVAGLAEAWGRDD